MRVLLLILSLANFLQAQDKVEEHTCRILFLNGPQESGGASYLFDGIAAQEVELPRLSLSPVYKLRPGNLVLQLLPAPPASPDKVPEGAPMVQVPAGVRDFYLIVTRDPQNKVMPVRLQLVNANADRIGRGQMLWFNLTQKPIAGKIGSEALKLAGKGTALVKEPTREMGGYPVELYFQVPGDDRTHPLIEGQWRHDPRARSLVFVYDEGKRRAPRVMSFSDFRVPEEKKE